MATIMGLETMNFIKNYYNNNIRELAAVFNPEYTHEQTYNVGVFIIVLIGIVKFSTQRPSK